MTDPERFDQQPPIELQFAAFVDRLGKEIDPGSRTWLTDPESGVMVYVRDNNRLVGPPNPLIKHPVIPLLVPCLDIGDVQYMHSIDPVDPDDFFALWAKIKYASPWKFVCLEDSSKSEIAARCRKEGWLASDWYDEDLLYIKLADRPPSIEATVVAES